MNSQVISAKRNVILSNGVSLNSGWPCGGIEVSRRCQLLIESHGLSTTTNQRGCQGQSEKGRAECGG